MEIKNLDDLSKAYDLAIAKFGKLGAIDSPVWFRGHRNVDWDLLPTVFRGDRSAEYEATVYRRFKSGALIRIRVDKPDDNDHFGWLSLMRHYGLPTRLLDWTESILVAAYFAVADDDDRNAQDSGTIWAFDPYGLQKTRRRQAQLMSPIDDEIRARAQDAMNASQDTYAFPIVPPQTDLRMLVQQAMFTMHGSRNTHFRNLDKNDSFTRSFVIPPDAKPTLLKAITSLGIHRYSLFPDLETLASGIIRREPPHPFCDWGNQ